MSDPRLRELNDRPILRSAKYVLYWMQASQRVAFNHALEHAIARSNELKLPILVCFGLMDDYPQANERHYAFLLEGLRDVEIELRARGIKFVVKHGEPGAVATYFAKHAAIVLCDCGYLKHQKRWRDEVADAAACKVVQVETDVVCPVELVSDHHEFAARTIRPKIHRYWKEFLVPVKATKVNHPSLRLNVEGDVDVSDPEKAILHLKLDRAVKPTKHFAGGPRAASALLDEFIKKRLDNYAVGRNEPVNAQSTRLSPYLHFGNISPVEIAIRVRDSATGSQADRDSLLEELIVRRELSMNFCHFNPKYDSYECLPNWSRLTLEKHAKDRREYRYTQEQLEQAQTHDRYWNAAQLEMTKTGFMHNYMRMYWGKKILEWSKSPQQAFATTLHLNNKYFYDGRDPNSFANVAWIYGLHDRPWTERNIFGTVRYMNAAGLERKFEIDAYVKKVERLSKPELLGGLFGE